MFDMEGSSAPCSRILRATFLQAGRGTGWPIAALLSTVVTSGVMQHLMGSVAIDTYA